MSSMTPTPYARLTRAPQPVPTPQMVGERLQQQAMQAEGGPGMGNPGVIGGDQAMGGMAGSGGPSGAMPPMDPSMTPMGAGPMAGVGTRLPAQGMMGDYDPAVEHSPSSTRSALEATTRLMASRILGSQPQMSPSGTREQLLRLGIPPMELDLFLQTGRFGDEG